MHAGRLQLVNCTRVGAYRLSHHYGRYSCFLLHYVWVLCLYQYQSRLMFSTSVRLLPFLWTWYFENPLKWFSCKLAKWFTGRQEDETINFCWVTQGHSRSFEMTPSNRVSVCHYSLSLSFTVSETFNVQWWRDLEFWVRRHSKSLKMVLFKSFGTVSYLHLTANGRIFSRFDTIH